MNKHLLLNIVALVVVYLAVLMGWQWVWGVLFMMWTIPALFTGEVHLIGTIAKKKNPVMFWLILFTWVVLSIYLIVADLIPALQSLA